MKHCAAVEPDQQFDFEKKHNNNMITEEKSLRNMFTPSVPHVYQISHNKETFMCKMWLQLPDGSTHAIPISQTFYQKIKVHFTLTTSDGENVYRAYDNGTDSNKKA